MYANQVQITKIMFYETGTFNDQYLRSYTTMVDANTSNKLLQATEGGNNLSAAALASVGQEIMKPSALAAGVAGITNGWENSRLSFFMDVNIPSGMGQTREIVCGYTDYLGISPQGNIDPEMTLFFNSSMVVHQSQAVGAHGVKNVLSVRDAAHYLTAPESDVMSRSATSASITPSDVFYAMESNEQSMMGEDVIDSRLGFLGGPKMSARSNSLSGNHLHRTFDAYLGAQKTANFYEDEYNTPTGIARTAVEEPRIGDDMFISSATGSHGSFFSVSAKWKELLITNPQIEMDSVTSVVLRNPNVLNDGRHIRGQSSQLNGADRNSIVASIFAHSLPALMLECMLTRFSCKISNDFNQGQVVILPTDANAFTDGLDPKPYIDILLSRIRFELIPSITQNNYSRYDININCHVIGETRIEISFDGMPHELFVIPSFSDALTAPVMAINDQPTRAIAHDLTILCEDLSTASAI